MTPDDPTPFDLLVSALIALTGAAAVVGFIWLLGTIIL